MATTIPKVYLNFITSLAAKMSSSASSFTLARSTDNDGTTLSGTYMLTFDEGRSTEEHMLVTLAGAAGTVVTRGLSRVTGNSNVAANQYEHDLGSSVKITDAPMVTLTRLLNGVDTFNAVDWLGVNSISGLATPTSGETTKAANVAYVNAVSLAGVSDAASNQKGVSELATAAEAAAGTASGSAGPLVIPASICNATSSAAVLVPVTEADGDLSIGFMPLDVTWTFTGIVDVATATNWKLGGTAFTGSMADLNEAATFFANTAATGANLTTLTAGVASDADALHTHAFVKKLSTLATAVNVTNTTLTTVDSITVSGGTLSTNNAIHGRYYISNVSTNSAGADVLTFTLVYGATTICTKAFTFAGAVSGLKGWIEFTIWGDGATNAQEASMLIDCLGDKSGADATVFLRSYEIGTAAEDSTANKTLALKVQWTDNAAGGDDVNIRNGFMMLIK